MIGGEERLFAFRHWLFATGLDLDDLLYCSAPNRGYPRVGARSGSHLPNLAERDCQKPASNEINTVAEHRRRRPDQVLRSRTE